MANLVNVEGDGFAGINNREDETKLIQPTVGQEQPGRIQLRDGKNMNLTNRRKLRKRKGRTKVLSLPGAHSGIAYSGKILCGANAGLCLVDPSDWSYTVLDSSISPYREISWARAGTRAYWTNGEKGGMVEGGVNYEWGLVRPGKCSVAAASTGGMRAGIYQVVCTFLSASGEESGAGVGAEVTVEEGGGIQVTYIPLNALASYVRFYITPPNGKVFYRHSTIETGPTTILLTEEPLGKPLETQFGDKPPVGHLIAKYEGWIFIAVNNIVYYTMPQRYGIVRQKKDWLPPFPNKIRMLQPVEGGIYVDDGSLYFVRFPKPDDAEEVTLLSDGHSVIPGSNLTVPRYLFEEDKRPTKEEIGYWWTKRGFPVLGLPNGEIRPVGEKDIASPKYNAGVSAFLEQEGIKQILTAFRDGGVASRFACTDTLTVRVVTRDEA